MVPGRTKGWWHGSVRVAIDERRLAYSRYQRSQHSESLRQEYLRCKRNVRSVVKEAKERHAREIANGINQAFQHTVDDHSPLGKKAFWNKVRGALGVDRDTVRQPDVVVDPTTGTREGSMAGILTAQAHHTQLLGSQTCFAASNPQFDDDWRSHVADCVQSCRLELTQQPTGTLHDPLGADVSEAEILAAMGALGSNKAPSPATGIPNELLKYGGQPMAAMLRALFNAVWAAGAPPQGWLRGVIQYFYKSGDPEDMANYRGITLLDVVSKLFHKVLANRLLQHAERHGLLHEAQNAFRPGRSTDEHIYCISQAVRGRQRQRKPTYAFFLDMRKAYDTVWRDGLMYKLWQSGIRGRLWHYIDSLYARSYRCARVGGTQSSWVTIDLGLAQGDTLSCVLFNLYINDLLQAYDNAACGIQLPSVRDSAEQCVLASQLFADDFVGLAESSDGLQAGVSAAYTWCNRWRMQANVGPAKSAVMLFAPEMAPGPLRAGDVCWGDQSLPAVQEYKYLGVMLTSHCRWDAHARYAAKKATKAAFAVGR